MYCAADFDQDAMYGYLMCWGGGQFGQNLQDSKEDIAYIDAMSDIFGWPVNHTVKFIASGASHTIAVTHGNGIYTWGNGDCGQLGQGKERSTSIPTPIRFYEQEYYKNPKVKFVACGGRHSLVLLDNGDIFGFGNNSFGQMPLDLSLKNYRKNFAKPRLLKQLAGLKVDQVACGEKHSAFRLNRGQVLTVGFNASGQLGNNTREESLEPVLLDNLPQIRYLTCGANHNLALAVDGSTYAWGLGAACGNKRRDVLAPDKIRIADPVVLVAGGGFHSLALTKNGHVFTWGDGSDGQLGHGDMEQFLTKPSLLVDLPTGVHIACGESYSTCITADGSLYIWGKNSHVINPDEDPSKIFWTPEHVLGRGMVFLSCGTWHVSGVTGTIVKTRRNPHGVDFDAAEVATNNSKFNSQGENCINNSNNPATEDNKKQEPSPPPLQREKTTVSLADFYAPTPENVLDLPEELNKGTLPEHRSFEKSDETDNQLSNEHHLLNGELGTGNGTTAGATGSKNNMDEGANLGCNVESDSSKNVDAQNGLEGGISGNAFDIEGVHNSSSKHLRTNIKNTQKKDPDSRSMGRSLAILSKHSKATVSSRYRTNDVSSYSISTDMVDDADILSERSIKNRQSNLKSSGDGLRRLEPIEKVYSLVEATSHPGPWGGLDRSQLKQAHDKFGSASRFAYTKNPYATLSGSGRRDSNLPSVKSRDRIILDPIDRQGQGKQKGRRKSKEGICRGPNIPPT